jgi:hypothetical protein
MQKYTARTMPENALPSPPPGDMQKAGNPIEFTEEFVILQGDWQV